VLGQTRVTAEILRAKPPELVQGERLHAHVLPSFRGGFAFVVPSVFASVA
jgi:hypothetical protein